MTVGSIKSILLILKFEYKLIFTETDHCLHGNVEHTSLHSLHYIPQQSLSHNTQEVSPSVFLHRMLSWRVNYERKCLESIDCKALLTGNSIYVNVIKFSIFTFLMFCLWYFYQLNFLMNVNNECISLEQYSTPIL